MKIEHIINLVKLVRDNKAFQDDVSYYSFLLSLIPVPGGQQAGQVINKLSSDHELKHEFDKFKESIDTNSDRLGDVENELIRIHEYAIILDSNDDLDTLLNI
jgi:hypothetical protein